MSGADEQREIMCVGGTDANAGISTDGVCQTLMHRAGTGGGNAPIILMRKDDERE